jgi:hypothetical protein
VDQDGIVGIGDVTCLIDYLLNGTWNDPITPPEEHEWVDLGLPSGTLWATCNVGAHNPEDYGDYFAWGETEPKEVYSFDTYKWCYYDSIGNLCFSKYTGEHNSGIVDNKTELDPDDDAAYVNWGSSWRMPSLEQQQELIEKCNWTWTQRNGVNCRKVTGPNGNSILLPTAGAWRDDSLYYEHTDGAYWSRTFLLNQYQCDATYGLFFFSEHVYWSIDFRNCGFSVRAVRVP